MPPALLPENSLIAPATNGPAADAANRLHGFWMGWERRAVHRVDGSDDPSDELAAG